MRGLVVDDDEVFARVLRNSLTRHGLDIDVAADSATALALARREPHDFALLDLKIGDASGLELIAPLRALRADMRIVLVTGYATFATAVEAIKRGADNYLAKPVTAAALLRALRGEATEPEPPSGMLPLHRLEWEHIQQALNDCQGNVSAAARLLGMHRRSLQRKLARRPRPPGGVVRSTDDP